MTFKNVNLEDIQVHPLFTVDEDSDDDEIKTVTAIHVARKESGKLMFAPRMRTAAELTSLEQIAQEFGGGEYVLIGYNNGRISARKTICLPGRSKPMFDEGIDPAPAPAAHAPAAAALPTPALTNDPMMSMVMMMMQQMMQQQAQAAQSQTQMFIAMMQNSRESSSEEKAQARAELQANIERERISSERTMSLMREMIMNKPTGGGEGFTQGAEFMRSIMTNQLELIKANANKDGGEWDLNSIMDTIGQVIQGASLLKGLGGGPLPEGVPGAPGAAEVAEAAQ